MGKISFIHLSDIHFVKDSDNPADIDKDLRDAILVDLRNNAMNALTNIEGVLVSGDIAFSGNEEEYIKAEEFLGRITSELNIEKSSIYCVPGNHDIDQSIPRESQSVYDAQKALDNAGTLDEADKVFCKYVGDKYYKGIIFKPLEKYNEFAKRYGCVIDQNKFNWNHKFNLNHGLVLEVYGMNSCFISNADDHKVANDCRKMYVGQAQIPSRKDDNICMVLCHHPPEYWKYLDQLQERINKRVDIQLYGHKHVQSIELTERNIIIGSGATHPVRGKDWNPRYNWITIECVLRNSKRVVRVKIYPRILSKDRDRFIPETHDGQVYIEHYLNIDDKRKKDLYDACLEKEYLPETSHQYSQKKVKRERIFEFYDLSYIEQTSILIKFNLLDDDNGDYNIEEIIERADKNDVINQLWNEIEKRYKEKIYAY